MKLIIFSFSLFLLLILFPMSTFQQSECFLCNLNHIQTSYCRAQSVVVATVVSERRVAARFGSYLVYKLQILDIYKMTEVGQAILDTEEVWSLQLFDICSPVLTINETYLLAGSTATNDPFRGAVIISGCSIVRTFSRLTEQEIYYFKGEYQDGCDCNICYTYGRPGARDIPCPIEDDPNMCKVLEPLNVMNPFDYQLCQRDNNGTCRWTKKYVRLSGCAVWEN